MRVFSDLESFSLGQDCALAIGNFDGLHLGHQQLLNELSVESKKKNLAKVVLTFDPHPRKFFSPDRPLFRIYTSEYQEHLFRELGIDALVRIPFNFEIAKLSAKEFVEGVLIKKFRVKTMVVGHDFCFGANREGNLGFLRQFETKDFTVRDLPSVDFAGKPVSSSRVREHLRSGEFEIVQKLIGREYFFEAFIVHGAGRGSRIGVPTANFKVEDRALPKSGVYCGWAFNILNPNERMPSIANLGTNPTFESLGPEKFEVHILEGGSNFYGQHFGFSFEGFIRNERKFSGPDELVRQIQLDIEQAKIKLKK